MDTRNMKILGELVKRQGNGQCADCGSKEVEYASYNIGAFLCSRCAVLHNNMGTHVSKTKHLKLDHWEDSQVDRLKQVGNLVAKGKFEARVPVGFRRPIALVEPPAAVAIFPPDPQNLLEHWITSKYAREEFISMLTTDYGGGGGSGSGAQQSDSSCSQNPPLRPYLLGTMDSFLMKKGREIPNHFPRRFVLDATTLRYFVKEKSHPKAVIRLVDLDVTLSPPKYSATRPHSLQLSYLKDGSTRHIYVYHDDPELVMQWYQAIRIGKLAALKRAAGGGGGGPGAVPVYAPESVLLSFLPHDSLMEGYLWKAGPSPSYAHRRRWFTLSYHRKLMYHIEPQDAYAKGEIFLGSSSLTDETQWVVEQQAATACRIFGISEIKNPGSLYLTGYKVSVGGFGDDKMDPQRWVFSLHTPYRTFILAAETQSERDKWVSILDYVLKQDLTPRDVATCSQLVRKRNGSTLGSISNPLSSFLSTSSSSTSTSSPTTNASCTNQNSSGVR